MKKLFYLFLLLPISLLVSCNDDKDITPADITMTLTGVTEVSNKFYTISGSEITVDNIEAKSIGTKPTLLQNITIFLVGIPLMNFPSFDNTFSTERIPVGNHSIDITAYFIQEGASLQTVLISYPLVIVESPEDLPAEAPELGTYSLSIRVGE